jgi:hypothetical protein
MEYPEFNLDELEQQQQDATAKKNLINSFGSVAKSFDAAPSAYDLLVKKTNVGTGNSGEMYDKAAQGVVNPIDRAKSGYELWKQNREVSEQKKKDDLETQSKDVKSGRSVGARGAYGKFADLGIQVQPDDTEESLTKRYGPLSELMTAKIRNSFDMNKLNAEIGARSKENALNRSNDLEKIQFKAELDKLKNSKSPEERLKAMSGTDKARYDNALMVAKAIDEMGTALDNGQNTYSMVGDNDYTAAERRAAEAFGRMQSGGAINKDEENRFLKMLPRSSDSKEMQRKKLIGQRSEMVSRLKTLGFTPEEAGYKAAEFNYGKTADELSQAASAGTSPLTTKPHPQDQEAFNWAMKNSNDPKAKAILQQLGVLK